MDYQSQSGRYYTRLSNIEGAREGIFNLVKEMVCSNDFLRFNQIKYKFFSHPYFLSFDKNSIPNIDGLPLIHAQILKSNEMYPVEIAKVIELSDLASEVRKFYYDGYKTIEIEFLTENSVFARAPGRFWRLRDGKEPKENAHKELCIDLRKFGIHIYTNDGGINAKLREFPDVILYKDKDVKIDTRSFFTKLVLYLGKKILTL